MVSLFLAKFFKIRSLHKFHLILDNTPEVEGTLIWLRENALPWIEVCNKWETTSANRLKNWSGDGSKSFIELSREYPAICHPDDYQLVSRKAVYLLYYY